MSSVSRAFACEPAALESPPADWRHEKSAAADIRVRTGVESASAVFLYFSLYLYLHEAACVAVDIRVSRVLESANCTQKCNNCMIQFPHRTRINNSTVRQRFGLTLIETNWGWLWFCKICQNISCFFNNMSAAPDISQLQIYSTKMSAMTEAHCNALAHQPLVPVSETSQVKNFSSTFLLA